ncbi:MAG: type I methionyl aminopeptidase [Candidatus Nanopelagicales bacterium]|nr:type I methionyl aminopeptidase [Candidatus Nanopelagicales bacterium]
MSSATQPSPVVPGRVSPMRSVPASIARPEYVGKPGPAPFTGSEVKDAQTIESMRRAGKLAALTLEEVGRHVRPGITTEQLDVIAHEFICDHGAYPSPLDYRGFPKSICTSVNEVICHGIPDTSVLNEGDIVNIDVTVFIEGVHGDCNATYPAGEVIEPVALLIERTREALNRGIKAVAPGRPISVIGRVIESYAKRFDYGVIRDFTGHGIGTAFHSGLVIPHYDDPNMTTIMEPGMTFTIEPMIALGTYDYQMWNDGWTVVTADRKYTAQFEHTVLVTNDGVEVLTV